MNMPKQLNSGHENKGHIELYHQALLQHHKQPTGFNIFLPLDERLSADGENPACGDEISVSVIVQTNKVSRIAFSGESCAICRASASMMCQSLENATVDFALNMVGNVSQAFENEQLFEGKLSPLNSVFSLPIRQQCALLPWHTLRQALAQKKD